MIQLVREIVKLARHADTSLLPILGIDARVVWFAPATLAVTFTLAGDIASIRIPVAATPQRANHLWHHTCFEAFVRILESPSYWEFNFSPSGEWAAYAFRDYRNGGPVEDGALDPRITVHRTADSLELEAAIRLDRLPGMTPSAKLRLGLSAVIEDNGGHLSYWALKHPPGKLDFHHPDCFALELSLPGQPA